MSVVLNACNDVWNIATSCSSAGIMHPYGDLPWHALQIPKNQCVKLEVAATQDRCEFRIKEGSPTQFNRTRISEKLFQANKLQLGNMLGDTVAGHQRYLVKVTKLEFHNAPGTSAAA